MTRKSPVGASIRKVHKRDCKKIWEIRNNSVSRRVSHNQIPIDYEHHKDWFDKMYFQSRNNHCFVLEKDGTVIGYCRYDLSNDAYKISITLEPEHHGKGLGNFLLAETIKMLKTELDLIAEVKKINLRSLRLFRRNKFKVFKEDAENVYLKSVRV